MNWRTGFWVLLLLGLQPGIAAAAAGTLEIQGQIYPIGYDYSLDGGIDAGFQSDVHEEVFLAPAPGQALVPGDYESAGGGVEPSLAIVSAQIGQTGCTLADAWFRVLEVGFDSSGNPASLAADFSGTCAAQPGQPSPTAYVGSVRLNSAVAAGAAGPYARPGGHLYVLEGTPVTLDGSRSFENPATPLTYAWSQTGGPAVSLAGASTATPSFTAPTRLAPGGAALAFTLTVSDASGRTDTQATTVQVAASTDVATFLRLSGSLLGGTPVDDEVTNSLVTAPAIPAGGSFSGGLQLDASGPYGEHAFLTLADRGNMPLQVGAYPGATGIQASGTNVLDFTGTTGADCSATTGSFFVADIAYDANGQVSLFKGTLTATCSSAGNPAATETGFICYRCEASPVPVVYAGADQSVAAGALVQLSATGSGDPMGNPLVYHWQQTSGPLVALSDASSPTPTFAAPSGGGSQLLGFRLTVTAASGFAAAADTDVSVASGAEGSGGGGMPPLVTASLFLAALIRLCIARPTVTSGNGV